MCERALSVSLNTSPHMPYYIYVRLGFVHTGIKFVRIWMQGFWQWFFPEEYQFRSVKKYVRLHTFAFKPTQNGLWRQIFLDFVIASKCFYCKLLSKSNVHTRRNPLFVRIFTLQT